MHYSNYVIFCYMAKYKNENFLELKNIFKALGEDNRLRTFMVLRKRELCVCQIVELLKLAPSTVSKHLSILNDAGIIDSNKNGRWVYYSISENIDDEYKNIIDSITDSLKNDEKIKQDAIKMMEILKIDPEKLCRIQSEEKT